MKQNILKIFAVLLTIVMLFALASCGGKDTVKENSETAGATQNTEENDAEGGIVTEKTGETDSGKKQTADKPTETPKAPETAKPTDKNETDKPDTDKTDLDETETEKNDETTSAAEPEEKASEGEIVIPSGGIELPIVKP